MGLFWVGGGRVRPLSDVPARACLGACRGSAPGEWTGCPLRSRLLQGTSSADHRLFRRRSGRFQPGHTGRSGGLQCLFPEGFECLQRRENRPNHNIFRIGEKSGPARRQSGRGSRAGQKSPPAYYPMPSCHPHGRPNGWLYRARRHPPQGKDAPTRTSASQRLTSLPSLLNPELLVVRP